MSFIHRIGRPRHWSRWLALTIITIGAIFAVWSHPSATEVSNALAIIFLVVGLLTAILATKLEKLENGLVRGIGLAKNFGEMGMVEACADFSAYDYNPIISESRKLVILLNDGRTWISFNRDRLRKRFADPAKETTIFLIHPKSPMIQVLARKGLVDAPVLQGRIRETVDELLKTKQANTVLEILGHHLFNPFSLFLGDDSALFVPYFASRGGRTVPVWKFEDTGSDCYFRDLVEDMERLRMDADNIIDCGKPAESSPK